jgi:hypothetical protein
MQQMVLISIIVAQYKATYASRIKLVNQFEIELADDSEPIDSTELLNVISGGNIKDGSLQSKIIVKAYKNHSLIERASDIELADIQFLNKKAKIEGNEYYVFDDVKGEFTKSGKILLKGNYTNNFKQVANFKCREWKTDEETGVTIWVCTDLPKTINPGFLFDKVEGAVLEYKDKKGSVITLISLEKVPDIAP